MRAVTIAAAIVTTVCASTGASSPAAAQTDGACDDNAGITVVVDFQELGGGVNVRCATGPVDSGLDALDLADVAWEGTLRFPAFVCRIAGLPTPDDEACANTPPATAYWSYWVAERGAEWCYANVGPTGRTPPPGSIEGWSFALNKAEAEIPPPRFDVPAAIPGQTPNPVRRSDCTTPEESGSAVTTSSTSSTTTSTTSTTSSTPTPASSTSTTTSTTRSTSPTVAPATGAESEIASTTSSTVEVPSASTVTPPVADVSTSAPTSTLESGEAVGAETTTIVPEEQTVDADRDQSSAPQIEQFENAAAAEAGRAADPEVGAVDLSDDRRGDGGFGVSSALAIAAIVGVVAAGVIAARRRTRPLRVET